MMRHPRTGDYCIKCDLLAQNAQFADSEQSNQQQQQQQQQQQVEEVEEEEDDREPTGGSAQVRIWNRCQWESEEHWLEYGRVRMVYVIEKRRRTSI